MAQPSYSPPCVEVEKDVGDKAYVAYGDNYLKRCNLDVCCNFDGFTLVKIIFVFDYKLGIICFIFIEEAEAAPFIAEFVEQFEFGYGLGYSSRAEFGQVFIVYRFCDF